MNQQNNNAAYYEALASQRGVNCAGPRAVGEFKGYIDGEPAVRWFDRKNMPQAGDKLFLAPTRAAGAEPRTWSILLTSANHGTVGPVGSTFPHAGEKHERVLVVEVPAAAGAPSGQVNLKLVAAPSASEGASVDTQALRDLVNQFLGMAEKRHHDERACLSKWGEIVAHIDQHVASQVQAAQGSPAGLRVEGFESLDLFEEWAEQQGHEIGTRSTWANDRNSPGFLMWVGWQAAVRKIDSAISRSGEGAALAGPVALTDERIKQVHAKTLAQTIDHNGKRPADFDVQFARAIAREVAAQAGQVAVQRDMNAAADFIEKRAKQYLQDHSDSEPETGAIAFEFGEAGREYHSVLVELADDLRQASKPAACTVPPAGWNCTRAAGHTGPCAASESLRSPQEAAGTEKGALTRCAAGRDGECNSAQCPQLRDNEPLATGRHCPLDNEGDAA